MKYLTLAAFVLLLTMGRSSGQTLFTYGNKPVSKQAFLKAFDKNPPKEGERRKALDEYLDLFINYKLKVQAAKDEHLDEGPTFQQEGKNFRKQIAENVVNEEVGIKRLTAEALERGKKDLHIAQVFVELSTNAAPADTLKALQTINAAYDALRSGKPFPDVSEKYSTDESVRKTKGDLGFISVFTIGYEFENQAYQLKPGSFSKPFRSHIGYHIFINHGERPAIGKRKIAQILIAMPPGFETIKGNRYETLADSVHDLLQAGQPFDRLAAEFSNDYKTANIGGEIGEIGTGQYDPVFEKQVFSITKEGTVAKPFVTNYGYHIVKLLSIKPAITETDDPIVVSEMRQLIEKDERLAINKKKMIQKWLQLIKYKPWPYNRTAFKQYTDSNLMNHITNGIKEIHDTTVIFSFETKKYNASDWAVWVTKKLTLTQLDYEDALKKFIEENGLAYYTENLEKYSTLMQEQCREFDEANLLFASMDKHVWSRAGEDSAGLAAYFTANKTKYKWQESADALVVSCKTLEMANSIAGKLKNNPGLWRSIPETYGTDAGVDSGRYELQQMPFKFDPNDNKDGFLSKPEHSGQEDPYTFVYILRPYKTVEQRSFIESKGLVINDYQQVLEKKWIEKLRKKYPVAVNQAVWKSVN